MKPGKRFEYMVNLSWIKAYSVILYYNFNKPKTSFPEKLSSKSTTLSKKESFS